MKYNGFVGSNGLASSNYNWTQISLHEMSRGELDRRGRINDEQTLFTDECSGYEEQPNGGTSSYQA
eukprot:scaffold4462_cov87-Skeletonema_marinoi.AAC.3